MIFELYLFLNNVSQNFANSSGDFAELFDNLVTSLLLTNLLQAYKIPHNTFSKSYDTSNKENSISELSSSVLSIIHRVLPTCMLLCTLLDVLWLQLN